MDTASKKTWAFLQRPITIIGITVTVLVGIFTPLYTIQQDIWKNRVEDLRNQVESLKKQIESSRPPSNTNSSSAPTKSRGYTINVVMGTTGKIGNLLTINVLSISDSKLDKKDLVTAEIRVPKLPVAKMKGGVDSIFNYPETDGYEIKIIDINKLAQSVKFEVTPHQTAKQ